MGSKPIRVELLLVAEILKTLLLAELKADLNLSNFKTLNGQSITGVGDHYGELCQDRYFYRNNATAAFVLTEALTVDFIFATVNGIMRYDFTYAVNTRTLTFDFAREPGILFTSSI
jgi:hypothetical protein